MACEKILLDATERLELKMIDEIDFRQKRHRPRFSRNCGVRLSFAAGETAICVHTLLVMLMRVSGARLLSH